MKTKRLRMVGLEKASSGEYENVTEVYFSLEEGLREIAFRVSPELRAVYEQSKEDPEQNFAFLQYLKAFMRNILVDYYFARREQSLSIKANRFLGLDENQAESIFSRFYTGLGEARRETLDHLIGSFRYLKNHFRSIYVALPGKARRILAKTQSRLGEIEFPGIMTEEADLYLLREHASELEKELPEKNRAVLRCLS